MDDMMNIMSDMLDFDNSILGNLWGILGKIFDILGSTITATASSLMFGPPFLTEIFIVLYFLAIAALVLRLITTVFF